MQVFFLAALGFALLGVLFALQNIVPVQVSFLAWTFEGSLAVVLFIAVILGALVSVLVSVPSIVSSRWTIRNLTRQIAALEAERAGSTTSPVLPGPPAVKPPLDPPLVRPERHGPERPVSPSGPEVVDRSRP